MFALAYLLPLAALVFTAFYHMLPEKKLTVTYFSPTNRFYKARLESNNQVISLSGEETLQLIGSTGWTTTQTKTTMDKNRTMLEKVYILQGS